MEAGRKTVFTETTLQKLEEVFALGGTDKEACFYADISESSLYNYQSEHPEFLERKYLLKTRPVLAARRAVIGAMGQNPNLAFRFLERRARDEFGESRFYQIQTTDPLEDMTDAELKAIVHRDCLQTSSVG